MRMRVFPIWLFLTVVQTAQSPCGDHCLTCDAASSCTTCEPGYFGIRCDSKCHLHCQIETCRKPDGQCECVTGYFIYRDNNGNNICSKCPEHCTACTSSSSCLACKPGFYGVTCQLPCTAKCENGFCQKPDGFCNCRKGTYALHGNDGFQCLDCPYACDTCTSMASCNSCKPAYFGMRCDSECHAHCQNETCRKADGYCACATGYFIYRDNNGKNICSKCPEHCSSCTSSSSCSECKPGFHGVTCQLPCTANCENGFCQKPDGFCNCSKGTYALHGNDGFQCLDCPYACDTCTSMASCNSCKPAYFGMRCDSECHAHCQNETCRKADGYCACATGYFIYRDNNGKNICSKCPEHCSSCTSSSSCSECKPGFHGVTCQLPCTANCENGFCQKPDGFCNCRKGTYALHGNDGFQCLDCPYACDTCTSMASCNSCKPAYFGMRCDSECHAHCQNETCRKADGYCACATGYFIYRDNNGNNICSKCPEHCSSCTSSSSCSECKPGFHGVTCQLPCTANCENGFCQKPDGFCNCRKGTYALHGNDGFQCLDCPYACDTCTSMALCNTCKPAYEIGYYTGGQMCNACPSNCKRCSSPRECEECMPGYYGTACQQQCGNCLRVPDKTSICSYNGNCVHGCNSGFVGEKCTISASHTSTAVIVGSILGTVFGLVILGVIVFYVVVSRKRRPKMKKYLVNHL